MAKRLAVADEDYDKAKEIKDEVDILRAEIEEKVTVTLGSWNLNSDIYPILLSFVLVIRLRCLSQLTTKSVDSPNLLRIFEK